MDAAHRRKKLLNHQRFVVSHLLKHKTKHGLLIAHSMGTGKTVLAIAVADAFPSFRDVVVVAPSHLRAVWEGEFSRYQLQATNIERFSFLDYKAESLESLAGADLSKTFIILDEAHHIVQALVSSPEARGIMRALQGSAKALLLSGTPIYNDEIDFAYLINIAAGKDVVTVDPTEFHLQFTKVHVLRSAFTGYWRPLINAATKYLPFAVMVLSVPTLFGLFPNILPAQQVAVTRIFHAVSFPARWVVGKLFDTVLTIPIWKKKVRDALKVVSRDKLDDPVGGGPNALTALLLICIVLAIINWLVAQGFQTDKMQLRVLNAGRLKPFIRQYVSMYSIDQSSSAFATKSMMTEQVTYTTAQLEYFLRFCGGLLSGKDISMLLADEAKDKLELLPKHYQKMFDTNIEYGLKIGNLPLGQEPPRKFEAILEVTKGQPAIVYTNFLEHGALLFQAFLESRRVPHVMLTETDAPNVTQAKLSRFNTGGVRMAILQPGLTEGLSFKGVRHVHFLEPVMQQAVREQVVARAVRYMSHAHLPPAERKVTVHTWVVAMSTYHFGDAFTKLKFWSKFQQEYMPGVAMAKFNYTALKPPLQRMKLMTADMIQLQRITTFGENTRKLLDEMKKYCIERQK